MSEVEMVITPRERDLGGFSVRRVLPYAKRRLVGPFVFFDHMGPGDFEPGQGMDVRPHPHIGIATVTYLFHGEIMHRDSLGYVQPIQPGAVNWMTAGKGIVHSERTPDALRETGFHIDGIQSWVALPIANEQAEPSFTHFPAETLPSKSGDGVEIRLIAGAAFGLEAPVDVFSPMFYADVQMEDGASIDMPHYDERAVYVVAGCADVAGTRVTAGSMAILEDDSGSASVEAMGNSHIMVLGGDSLEGERTIFWNFVHSDPATIEAAKTAWDQDEFPKVPDEHERIPLPPSS